ncbi:DNA gyrase subunit B [Lentisphaera araneosa HTCC2155]|uniref:DNA gyrase subunit B n=1 Tax=Lentisphaera araneosa HTCC2155 TaxID=313628 RepID=A6DH73_9BACT|nr:DNA topoisomerase (ATP-hydrolyzing) subunit B [Lentisphaera araneosa]EDM28956.1 DNA gyrase subunit B [Lentisphaera araneosa HTCC2155]
MSEEQENQAGEYGADSISVMKGLEAVRKRPSMYIGDTNERGLHHLVYEVVDNSIDEALAGHCNNITVKLHIDNSVTVVDDGRGIPVNIHEEEGIPAVELVLTKLHAGGKFDKDSYKVSGGLHGVGVSCVNALSEWMEVKVHRDETLHFIRFERGLTETSLKTIGHTNITGTEVIFKPDFEIFTETLIYKWDILAKRLRELAFLNPGITINFIDERAEDGERRETFYFPGGIGEFVKHLNDGKTVVTDTVTFSTEKDGVTADVSFQYHDGFQENIYSYCNNIHTIEGGTHLAGFQTALTASINSYMKNDSKFKNEKNVSGTDVREGLTAIISVKVPEPQFEGQTKTKLGNNEVRSIVRAIVSTSFNEFLEENPKAAKVVVEKALLANRASAAALRARQLIRKDNVLEGFADAGKLSGCSSKNPDECEIFIVEGDSAGGSAKQGRNSEVQAILPLRGKLINVEKARIDKVFANTEIGSLISAIGCGVGNEFDVEKIRYKKIVIMTDADVDGSHIMTLLLTFFFRQMKPLIEAGYIYVAQPPLYKVVRRKREEYIKNDAMLNNFLLELGVDGITLENKLAGNTLSPRETNEILALIKRTLAVGKGLENHGVTLETYLQHVLEDGSLPIARVGVREDDGTYSIYFPTSQEELAQIIDDATERLKPVITFVDTDAESETIEGEEVLEGELVEEEAEEVGIHPSIEVNELHEKTLIEEIREKLETVSLTLQHFLEPEDALAEPIFNLTDGNNDTPIFTLIQLFEAIKDEGSQGLKLQRYKGLGEMNADQLWETTMDPTRRDLLQVTMEDAVEAERMFSLLMGDVVEPRRHFIEKYSTTLKELDV